MRGPLWRGWGERFLGGPAVRAAVAIAIVGFVCVNATLVGGHLVGVGGTMWFRDSHLILLAFGAFLATAGLAWDALLLAGGLARRALVRRAEPDSHWWHAWRRRGFYSLGAWPLPIVLLTIYFLICTSNVSYISLQLLEDGPRWQDAALWELEGRWIVSLTSGGVSLRLWETIYNSGWNAEMLALFAILVSTRCPARVAGFCVSFLLLFYLGRFAGLAAPVMGPALHAPEHFGYLDGSVTRWMMAEVQRTMQAGTGALADGAMRLGGVAAMPSLHVGMVALAGWWLARSMPWTAPLVVAWVLAVWASTVLLGWHYAVDGLGGLATAALCIALTGPILEGLGVRPPADPV